MSSRYQAGIVLPGYNALKVANAPTIGTATVASSTSVSVAFTAPACTGGGAISGYTVFANCGIKLTSGASSPLVVTGLTTGTTYTFKAIATNVFGPSYPSAASNSATPLAPSQDAYTTAGTFSWVAPAGVSSVSVVAIGGGGGSGANGGGNAGGSGAGLGYKNNYSVTPGNSYTVVVGAGGVKQTTNPGNGVFGGNSYFVSVCVVKGGGGQTGWNSGGVIAGGTYTGDGGGNGGASRNSSAGAGGGGAGGYAGAGGRGGSAAAGCCGGIYVSTAGSGGGGGGGGYNDIGGSGGGGGGGGTGILGQGSNGAAGAGHSGGGGGSGGASGTASTNATTPGQGGAYGGGSGGPYCGCIANANGKAGAVGAVRIIWPGTSRSFPSTCTGNL